MEKVAFTQMKDGTKEEYDFLTEHETDYAKDTAKRLMKAMVELDASLSGYSSDAAWAIRCNLPHGLGGTGRILTGSSPHCSMTLATYTPPITMMNTRRRSCARLCANNAHGAFRPTAISRWSITGITWAVTPTSATSSKTAPFSTIARCFANAGTRRVSILRMTPCRCRSLRRWSKRCLPARPMIRISYRLAFARH